MLLHLLLQLHLLMLYDVARVPSASGVAAVTGVDVASMLLLKVEIYFVLFT